MSFESWEFALCPSHTHGDTRRFLPGPRRSRRATPFLPRFELARSDQCRLDQLGEVAPRIQYACPLCPAPSSLLLVPQRMHTVNTITMAEITTYGEVMSMSELPVPRIPKPGPGACSWSGPGCCTKDQYLSFIDGTPAPQLMYLTGAPPGRAPRASREKVQTKALSGQSAQRRLILFYRPKKLRSSNYLLAHPSNSYSVILRTAENM